MNGGSTQLCEARRRCRLNLFRPDAGGCRIANQVPRDGEGESAKCGCGGVAFSPTRRMRRPGSLKGCIMSDVSTYKANEATELGLPQHERDAHLQHATTISPDVEPLPPGTVRYDGEKGPMILLSAAKKQYDVSLDRLENLQRIGEQEILRERRRIKGLWPPRLFILEDQCRLMKEAIRRQIELAEQAENEAEARGLESLAEFALALGVKKNTAHTWLHHGCPYLPGRANLNCERLPPRQIGGPDRAFISKKVREEIRAARDAAKARPTNKRTLRDVHLTDTPQLPDRIPPRIKGRLGWYTFSGLAAWRLHCTPNCLRFWFGDNSMIPGDWKKLRRERGPDGRYWYYLESDINKIQPAVENNPPRDCRPQHRRACVRWKDHLPAFPTSLVAEICGVRSTTVWNWGTGEKKTPGDLPFDEVKFHDRRQRTSSLYWNGGHAIAIARRRGQIIPEGWDKLFPVAGIPQPLNGQAAPEWLPPGDTAVGVREAGRALHVNPGQISRAVGRHIRSNGLKGDCLKISLLDCQRWNRARRDKAESRATMEEAEKMSLDQLD